MNINNSEDPFYRYTMPKLIVKTEGSGNGKKTVLLNIEEIAISLDRSVGTLVKYFGYQLGTKSAKKGDRYIINGHISLEILQDILYSFIGLYVLCELCENPETKLRVSSKGLLKSKCASCGHKLIFDDTKIVKYMIKNIK